MVRLLILLVLLMSGAILAQAALDGSTVLRFVQTSAVLSGLVPYGLFFLIAVAYAVGAARIGGRGALVQQTNAVEAISRVDVVCTDKTGTLTSGRLALVEVVPAGGDEAGARALLGTFARSVASTNATTTALAADTSLPGEPAEVLDEVEFRSSLRWSGITLADGTALVLGAPSTVRPALADAAVVTDDAVRRRTGEGLRVLVLARGEGALHDADGRPRLPRLRAVALVALADELREGVTDVLTGLAAEGVAVKVVSGDDPDTVAALARRAGLDAPAMAGPALARLEGPDTDAFDDAVDTHGVFGRIAPEQKEQIVASLARRGHQVAMVGDGVNDARALKRAQVGVAMRSGSSVTRDVADIVLLDDSFATLPPARTEGRRIIAGVGSSMYLFLSRVATQMLVILTVTLLGLGFPYTPTQVGLTLFTVGVPTFFLTLWARPKPPDDDLLVSLARFVIPVGVLTAGLRHRDLRLPLPPDRRRLHRHAVPAGDHPVRAVHRADVRGGRRLRRGLGHPRRPVRHVGVRLEHRDRAHPAARAPAPDLHGLGAREQRPPAHLARARPVRRVRRRARRPGHPGVLRAHRARPARAGDSGDRPGAVVRHAERRAAVPGARTRPRPPPATGPDGPGHSLTGRALPRSGAFSVQASPTWRPRRDLDHHRGCRVQSVSDGRPSVLVRYTPSGPGYGPGGGSGGPRPCGTCTGVLTRATPTASTRSTVGARPAPTAGPVVVGARAARRRRAARSSTSGATPRTRPRPPTFPSRCVSVGR